MERTSLFYDSLVRTHDHLSNSNHPNPDDPDVTVTATLDQYYDIVECIGRGSFSTVYKIRKKRDKIGGSSRPANMRKSSSVGTSLHSLASTGSASCNDSNHTAMAATGSTPNDEDILSPLLSPKNMIQRQRSLRYIRSDNEGNLFSDNTKNQKNQAVIPELFFVLKEMDLSKCADVSSPSQLQQQQQYQLFVNEIQILKTLDHPHIVKIYETFSTPAAANHNNKLQVVMEYCRGGDLYTRIPYQNEEIIRHMVQQMMAALHYIHDRNIIHRDIKFENFVFEQTYDEQTNIHHPVIKLIDFGVSYVVPEPPKQCRLTERIGTLYTMSPETILQKYSFPADVWSLGVCIYMLLSAHGQAPFTAPTNKEMIQNILAGRYAMTTTSTTTTDPAAKGTKDKNNTDVWTHRSEASKDLIRHLLVVDPNERYTIQQAQNHPWVQQPSYDTGSAAVTADVPTTTNNDDHIHSIAPTPTTTSRPVLLDTNTRRSVRDAMIRYAFSTGDFMKLALNVLAKQAMAQDIEDLRTIFDSINYDRTGTISYDQFRTVLFPRDHGATDETTEDENPYSDAYIEKLFRQLDVNKNNVITYTEFIAAVLEMHGKIEEYRFAEAFDQLDCDDSGFISKENIQELLGDDVDAAYIDKLIAEADYLNDGRISYGEFKQAFRDQMKSLVSSIRSRSSLSEMLLSDSERSDLMIAHTYSSE